MSTNTSASKVILPAATPSEDNQAVNKCPNESLAEPNPSVGQDEANSLAMNLAVDLVEAQQKTEHAEAVVADPTERNEVPMEVEEASYSVSHPTSLSTPPSSFL